MKSQETTISNNKIDPSLTINLFQLVSACIHLCHEANKSIQQIVQSHQNIHIVNKALPESKEYDPQTVADRLSQQIIVGSLLNVWPDLNIVGEEEDLFSLSQEQLIAPLHLHLLENIHDQQQETLYSKNELVVWIDPLDGTKSFIEKKYDDVTVLIGICFQNKPIGGIIGRPFHCSNNITWGIVGSEVVQCDEDLINRLLLTKEKINMEDGTLQRIQNEKCENKDAALSKELTISISNSDSHELKSLLPFLEPYRLLRSSGAGNKIMQVVQGQSDVYILCEDTTKRWDICAGEGILVALGGVFCNVQGISYQYVPNENLINDRGILACRNSFIQDRLLLAFQAKNFLKIPSNHENQSVLKWLNQIMVKQGDKTCSPIEKYTLLPKSIRCGRHSFNAILQVVQNAKVNHFFIKKCYLDELPHRPWTSWKRDALSYCNEVQLYQHVACHLPQELFPKVFGLYSELHQKEDDHDHDQFMRSKFFIAMEYLEQWTQKDELNQEYSKLSLQYLAQLHASCWGNHEHLQMIQTYLWKSGGYWTFEKRGMLELERMQPVWKKFCTNFQLKTKVGRPLILLLGERLEAFAKHQLEGSQIRDPSIQTLIHGDFKSMNLFFSNPLTKNEIYPTCNERNPSCRVKAIDWQWSGMGIGAMDVALFLHSSVALDALNNGGELDLLQYYFSCLTEKLTTNGLTYEWENFLLDYKVSVLDYARMVCSYFWNDASPELFLSRRHMANRSLVSRSVEHAMRFIDWIDTTLEEFKF